MVDMYQTINGVRQLITDDEKVVKDGKLIESTFNFNKSAVIAGAFGLTSPLAKPLPFFAVLAPSRITYALKSFGEKTALAIIYSL